MTWLDGPSQKGNNFFEQKYNQLPSPELHLNSGSGQDHPLNIYVLNGPDQQGGLQGLNLPGLKGNVGREGTFFPGSQEFDSASIAAELIQQGDVQDGLRILKAMQEDQGRHGKHHIQGHIREHHGHGRHGHAHHGHHCKIESGSLDLSQNDPLMPNQINPGGLEIPANRQGTPDGSSSEQLLKTPVPPLPMQDGIAPVVPKEEQSIASTSDQLPPQNDSSSAVATLDRSSPVRFVSSLADTMDSAGQLTPDVKKQFEEAIKAADSGSSPALPALQKQFETASQSLQKQMTPDVQKQLQDVDKQITDKFSSLNSEDQQQAKAVFDAYKRAGSSDDAQQYRDSLLQLAPDLSDLLDQRDKETAPMQNDIYKVNSLSQDITTEKNQSAVTRLIYAQVLSASGDDASAQTVLKDAAEKNNDPDLLPVLQRGLDSTTSGDSTVSSAGTDPGWAASATGGASDLPTTSTADGTASIANSDDTTNDAGSSKSLIDNILSFVHLK